MSKRAGSATAAQRTRLPREERIEEILLAAREVFAERGYSDASVAEIAAQVGVVEGAVYRFFESKRDLLIRVVSHWYQEVMASYERGLDAIAGPRNRLRYFVWHYVTCIHDYPELTNLFVSLVRLDPAYLDSSLYEFNKRYAEKLNDLLREGIEARELRKDISLRLARDLIFGAVEHRTWAFRVGLSDFDPTLVADEIANVIFDAFAPKPPLEGPNKDVRARLVDIAREIQATANDLAGKSP